MTRYRLWVDEVSKIFNGLDMCAVEAVVNQDSKEYIIEVSLFWFWKFKSEEDESWKSKANGCSFNLLGDSQEEDREHIAGLVAGKMQDLLNLDSTRSEKTQTKDITVTHR